MTWQGILELDEIKSLYFKTPRQAILFCLEAVKTNASQGQGRVASAWGRHAWNQSIRDKSASQRIDCISQTLSILNQHKLYRFGSDFALALCGAGLKQHNPKWVFEGVSFLFQHSNDTGMMLGYRYCHRHKIYLEDHGLALEKNLPEVPPYGENFSYEDTEDELIFKLQTGWDPTNLEEELDNLFCLAVEKNLDNLAQLLLDKGHPLNSVTFCDHSALHKACLTDNLAAARFLICEGLYPHKKDLNAKLAHELAPKTSDWEQLWQNMLSVPSLTHST
jgi:hypothetical protein